MKNLVFLWLFLLGGCASVAGYNFEPSNLKEAETYISFEKDEFESKAWLRSKPVVNTSYGNAIYNLRALYENGSKSPSFVQIYVNLRLFDWYFINDVVAKNHNVSLTEIDRIVMSGGAVHEDVAVNISLSTLKAMSEKEIKFKLKGKRGDYIFTVNPDISKAFLNQLDGLKNNS